MKLYLVQHAKATLKDVDPERSLTEAGKKDVRNVSNFIKPLNLSIDYFWHSGKKRAEQTAKVLGEVVEVRKEMTAREGLAPNDDVAAIKDEIISCGKDIIIVGHQPFVSKLASLLLTGSELSGTVAFRQGGIVCLNCYQENQWQIDWMIIPELICSDSLGLNE
jgi:phosphohistidine phosphatase